LSNQKGKAFSPIAVQDGTWQGTIKSCAYRAKINQVFGYRNGTEQGQVVLALGKKLDHQTLVASKQRDVLFLSLSLSSIYSRQRYGTIPMLWSVV
jgi:hypothetical protein